MELTTISDKTQTGPNSDPASGPGRDAGLQCGLGNEPVEEPFCLPVPEDDTLAPARAEAKAMAESGNRPFVPYQRLFSGELVHLNPDPRYWCAADGVTPTLSAKIEMAAFRLRAIDAFEHGAGQWWNNTSVFAKGMKVGDDVLNVPRIPSIVCAGNGDLVAVCDMRCADSEDLMYGGRITTIFSRSTDGGATWSAPEVVRAWPWNPGSERWSASDPSLLADRDTGTIFCFANVMEHENGKGRFKDNCLYRHYIGESHDNGKTWGNFRDITSAVSGMRGIADAAERQQIFITSGSGIQLNDGSLVVNCNWVNQHKAVMIRSADHGRTWEVFGTPAWPSDENKLVELPDGRLVINARAIAGYGREIHVSSDCGATWEWHTDINLVDPRCNAEVVCCKAADGTPILAYAGCGQRRRSTLVLRLSRDNGVSWSERILDPAKCGYVDIAVLHDGSLGILYESDVFERIRYVRIPRDDLV